ncbi:MAG TPA: glycosyltransferase, partial [Blastocatellia bacterium]|nr:glycosyltransferase [Blastocatellia bacterium]
MSSAMSSGMHGGRLRVLQVGKFYPPFMGGMETHLQALCEQMSGRVDVKVVVANGARQTAKEVSDGVEVTRLATMFNFAAAPVCPALPGEIYKTPADIVHIHVPNPTAILAFLASNHKGRLVITYHSDTIRQRVLGWAFEPVLHRALRRSGAIIATSPNYIDSSDVLSLHRSRCRVIPHGIRLERFERMRTEKVSEIRKEFGPRIVLGVGRLIYYKGFEHLIRAMTRVDGRLLIVGDGPLRSSLEEQARELGVSDRVVFLGEVDDVTAYYQAADIFALASTARSEAFGIVQLEAMACGKPVVNTRLESGVPYVSIDRQTGITVPPASADALAEAINLLFADESLRLRYGAAARERARREFCLDKMVD